MLISYDQVLQSAIRGEIPWDLAEKGFKRIKTLKRSIEKLEEDSGLTYPEVMITPVLKILLHSSGVESIVHGHIDFKKSSEGTIPYVNISLPFILNGTKRIYDCVLAHELLHYLYIAKKVITKDYFSLEQKLGDTIISHMIFDEISQFKPETVFKNKTLIRNLEKKFDEIVNNEKFVKKIEKSWIGRNLPVLIIPEDQFIVKFQTSEFMTIKFPKDVLNFVLSVK